MASVIKSLPEELISQIAAGEVLERPSSAVKELVENAIDADASRVEVRVREGGTQLIQVSDNGCGMAAEDLPLAVSRHATSKISQFDDLYKLTTRGFRGEALASIASVARVEIASARENTEGSEIIVEGGKILDQRACGHNRGTTITVKHLFHQTPARLKFMRSAQTEMGHISDVVQRLALSCPDVGFFLYHNDKLILSAPEADLRERFIQVIGSEHRDEIYPFFAQNPGLEVKGYFLHPQKSLSQRTGLYFFVNGRPIQDKVIAHAVQESFRDLLMRGRFPVMALFLQVNPGSVDVNVHPQKSEVRFHESQKIHSFIYQTIRSALRESPWMSQNDAINDAIPDALPRTSSTESYKARISEAIHLFDQKNHDAPPRKYDAPKTDLFSVPVVRDTPAPSLSPQDLRPSNSPPRFATVPYHALRVIGQLLGTYILCEGNGKMILIDQHAAHERIGFEKLLLEHKSYGIKKESLLIPETFDLPPSESEILKQVLGDLESYGFEMDFFGGQTFVIKTVPVLLKDKVSVASLVSDLIADLKEKGEIVSLKDKLHHVFATMACHAQIRAHHILTLEECQELLRELDHYQFTDFCPHGRPVSIEINLSEIEKWFKRIL